MTIGAREQWLTSLALAMEPEMRKRNPGLKFGKYRVTCGFPSKGGMLGRKKRTRGECWDASASSDNHAEVFISPVEADGQQVAEILAHEMIHVAVGCAAGHKAPFTKVARAIGFVKPFTSAVSTPALHAWLNPLIAALGPYPHATLNARAFGKVQTTRYLKCECPECGYAVRITSKWLQMGAPICPACDVPTEEK